MENKLTAVGWLVNKLMKESTGYISLDALASYTEQALEMEREQIMSAYIICDDSGTLEESEEYAEKYYNRTYTK